MGPKSSTENSMRVGANARSVLTTYIDAQLRDRETSHPTENTARLGAYSDASSTRPESSTDSDMRDDANVRAVPGAYINATTARLESSDGSSIHVDASGAESKPTVGSMYNIAKHECDDAVTSEFNTGDTMRLQRRLPESREDNEQSSVIKDDTQSCLLYTSPSPRD